MAGQSLEKVKLDKLIFMGQTGLFIQNPDGTSIEITWIEFNQLKKDILWVFDENIGDLWNAYVPLDSFTLPYWEYTTLYSDGRSSPAELQFLREGALIIVLCVIAENIDPDSGNLSVFKNYKPATISHYMNRIEPDSEEQRELIGLILLGLKIAADADEKIYWEGYEFAHPDRDAFFEKLGWVNETFIVPYFKSKC